MVIHTRKICHLRQNVDEGVMREERCRRKIEDLSRAVGFADPSLEFIVPAEVEWGGVICVNKGRDEAVDAVD